MAANPESTVYVTFAIGALVAWRLYGRMRRLVGRQRLRPVRAWLSATVLPLALALLLLGVLRDPPALAALLGGAAAGTALGRLGTRLTRFEATPAGLFYTPNAHLGIALSLLLVARLAWRAVHLHLAGESFDPTALQASRSPLTLAIVATLCGYYACYAVGLLRWRARAHAQAERATPP